MVDQGEVEERQILEVMQDEIQKPIERALRECLALYELVASNEGVDADGDFFTDLEFTGRNGNHLFTRVIAREESNQLVVVTQLPIKVNGSHREEILLRLHKINAGLAVGAFTLDKELKFISFRSGFNYPTSESLSAKFLALTLTSNVDVADRFLPCILRIVSKKR